MSELLERYAQPVYRLEPETGQEAKVALLEASLRRVPGVTEVLATHDGLRVLTDDPAQSGPAVLAAVVEQGVALATFERLRPSLEEVFLRLTRAEREQAA